ncbi:MAG: TVP38/TMEM64 family protein [Betaproteobacteria bacterium]|nr:TVP38/TMEM64 family protein [Betaproteobacteria bacterium]MDH5221299.1 TVP38/TMEM64 family protein [Betaproteobacteria bacterium]MDH5351930.1 TVP38/TMEM64 family protein [Betaproteobacteria bacterium]
MSADPAPLRRSGTGIRILAAIGFVIALVVAYRLLQETGALKVLLDVHAIRAYIMGLGMTGPLAVVALIALAVLVSPLPSAPVALAAGALYGHTWGTVYVLSGAMLGALGAFSLARLLGREALQRWLGHRLPKSRLGSQGSLMTIVFVSRLLPFISFDVVSYATGLTNLALWRFAVATLVGVLPTSFLLAHFGGEMVAGELDRMLYAVLALGLLTAVPLAAYFVRERMRRSRP